MPKLGNSKTKNVFNSKVAKGVKYAIICTFVFNGKSTKHRYRLIISVSEAIALYINPINQFFTLAIKLVQFYCA